MNQPITASEARSWPFQEARKLLEHITRKGKKPGDLVTFETGYGPSGAPHIGTFGEIVRTLWVMKAFRELTQDAYRTRLIMFSDDYDGMRKVPDGLPAWMNDHIGKPLSEVPNPYEDHPGASFADANNIRLVEFANRVITASGEDLMSDHPTCRATFISSSQMYKAGRFNDLLDRVWDCYDAIQAIMLPTLGEDRRATYSPFMVKGNDGTLIQSGVTLDVVRSYVAVGNRAVASIHNGGSKLQWKVDWAMRWVYFDVDYEMSGKDLTDSVRVSGQICKALGGVPPMNLTYELFLDSEGRKISKTVGNGFSIEEWLQYGDMESLALFMFQNPKAAKPIHIDVVPRLQDDYYKALAKTEFTYDDPVWHIHAGKVPVRKSDVNFSLLLNMAMVAATTDPDTLVSYLEQIRPLPDGESDAIYSLASRAIRYMVDTGRNARERRMPTEQEALAFEDLATRLEAMEPGLDAESYQFEVYEVGKAHRFEPLRDWFKALYECLLGSSDGPRFGAFTAAYGLENTIKLLRQERG